MKKCAILMLLVLPAACSSTGQPSEKEREVRQFFESWVSAILDGRFEQVYNGMTPRLWSLWMRDMMREDAREETRRIVEEQRRDLAGSVRVELDFWNRMNGKKDEDAVQTLPDSVLKGDWLKKTLRLHFEAERRSLKAQFYFLKVREVAVGLGGATVTVNYEGHSRTELYVCKFDGQNWRVDGHVHPRNITR